MKKAAREENEEAEDIDKFMRDKEEEEEAAKKGRGRGRGGGKGKGRGRGRGKAQDKEKQSTESKQGADETAEDVKKAEEKECAGKRKKPSSPAKILSPSLARLHRMRRMKSAVSDRSSATTKRCLAAELEAAESHEDRAATAEGDPEKSKAPETDGGNGPKIAEKKKRHRSKAENEDAKRPKTSASSKRKEELPVEAKEIKAAKTTDQDPEIKGKGKDEKPKIEEEAKDEKPPEEDGGAKTESEKPPAREAKKRPARVVSKSKLDRNGLGGEVLQDY